MSAYSHPSQQLDSRATTSPSSTQTSTLLNSSADEECKLTSGSHFTLEPTFCSSSSQGGFAHCPLSSKCGELKSTLNSVDTVSIETSPPSNYTCSSQQLPSSSLLPLSSTCGVVTINRETQDKTGQLEEVEESIHLELSDRSFSSQREIAESPDSHGISCMDNSGCSVQVQVDQTGLPMEEPGNSSLLISDNSEQSTILSDESSPLSGTAQQSNTVKSCKANSKGDTSLLQKNHDCASKSNVDTNDQGPLSSKETNDPCQSSALSSKKTTNDQCQGSALSSNETNDPCQGSALSSKETDDQCQGSALSSHKNNDQYQVSALSSNETNDQCQGSALSSKETNDPCQGSALSSEETNDQYQGSALSSKETSDPCQGSALSSEETNYQYQSSLFSSNDSSCKLYNFMIVFHEDDTDAADRIFFLLEEKHHLRGFKNGRDDMPGTYKSDEVIKAIENSDKILLLLTPKSIDDGQFNFLMHLSLRHSIEEGDNAKLIPICFGIQCCQTPKVLRSKYCINYENFSDNFEARLFRVFHSQSSLTSSVSKQLDSPASPSCSKESEASTKSSGSPKIRQSHSVPPSSPQKKPWYARFFSSPK